MYRYSSSENIRRIGLFVAAFAVSVVPAEGKEAEWAPEPAREILFGGPQVGERAPEFVLKDLQGRSVELKQFRKKRPVILVTGSHTCPIYRDRMRTLQFLYEKYRDRAAFYILYTLEAHPKGAPSPYAGEEWIPEQNVKEEVLVKQPHSYAERVALALRSQKELHSSVPILVDEMDDAVWEEYGSAPNAAFVIDYRGKVAFRQNWFEPLELEPAIVRACQEEPF